MNMFRFHLASSGLIFLLLFFRVNMLSTSSHFPEGAAKALVFLVGGSGVVAFFAAFVFGPQDQQNSSGWICSETVETGGIFNVRPQNTLNMVTFGYRHPPKG